MVPGAGTEGGGSGGSSGVKLITRSLIAIVAGQSSKIERRGIDRERPQSARTKQFRRILVKKTRAVRRMGVGRRGNAMTVSAAARHQPGPFRNLCPVGEQGQVGQILVVMATI